MTTGIGATGAPAGYGFNATLVSNASSVHQNLDTLIEQASTGLISQTYAGLGNAANVSLSLSPQLATLQTYQDNIGQATGRMQSTQASMTQIQQDCSFVRVRHSKSERA